MSVPEQVAGEVLSPWEGMQPLFQPDPVIIPQLDSLSLMRKLTEPRALPAPNTALPPVQRRLQALPAETWTWVESVGAPTWHPVRVANAGASAPTTEGPADAPTQTMPCGPVRRLAENL